MWGSGVMLEESQDIQHIYIERIGIELGSSTKEGDSPVRVKDIYCTFTPSNMEHEEFCVNQRGPNLVRQNTLTNR